MPHEEGATDGCHVQDRAAGIPMLRMAEALPHRIYNIGAGTATRSGLLRSRRRRSTHLGPSLVGIAPMLTLLIPRRLSIAPSLGRCSGATR